MKLASIKFPTLMFTNDRFKTVRESNVPVIKALIEEKPAVCQFRVANYGDRFWDCEEEFVLEAK